MRATLKRWGAVVREVAKKALSKIRALVGATKKPPAAETPTRFASRGALTASATTSAGAKTQPLSWGALAGRRYGSFASKTAAPVTSAPKTQPYAWGCMTGRRQGSFAGKSSPAAAASGRPPSMGIGISMGM